MPLRPLAARVSLTGPAQRASAPAVKGCALYRCPRPSGSVACRPLDCRELLHKADPGLHESDGPLMGLLVRGLSRSGLALCSAASRIGLPRALPRSCYTRRSSLRCSCPTGTIRRALLHSRSRTAGGQGKAGGQGAECDGSRHCSLKSVPCSAKTPRICPFVDVLTSSNLACMHPVGSDWRRACRHTPTHFHGRPQRTARARRWTD